MNGVKANARPRLENTRLREPSVLKLPHSRPVQVMFLTASNENLSPQPRHPEAKCAEPARTRAIISRVPLLLP
jgi:hypothetical protein